MNNEEFKTLFLRETPLIDVRAPVEYAQGHLPNAVNLPILNNAERELIGKTYKQKGSEAAVKLGYELISGSVKDDRVKAWKDFAIQNPQAVIYCFRGGQRSQIARKWLTDAGVQRPLIPGGYKLARQFFLDQLKQLSSVSCRYVLISGATGSGKTTLLRDVSSQCATVDLEYLAQHKGSAFGGNSDKQPSQVNFENQLVLSLLKQNQLKPEQPIILEDESYLIGRCALPKVFFDRMRSSPVVWLDVPFDERVENIYLDYIVRSAIGQNHAVQAHELYLSYLRAIEKISRKLGFARASEITGLLKKAWMRSDSVGDHELHKEWIAKLLLYHYDPLYFGSLQRRQVQVLFKGAAQSCRDFLSARL